MNEHFTIGETSRLNNISIQTLRYYDKLGVFKPVYTDPKNNYRYYHIKQFFYLDIVKYLRSIHTPLEEIKHTILNSPREMESFLDEQEEVIEQEFRKLELAKALLQKRKNQLKEQLEICDQGKGEVYTRNIKEEKILKMATPELHPNSEPGFDVRKFARLLEDEGAIMDNQYGYIYDLGPNNQNSISYNYMYTTIFPEELIDTISKVEKGIISAGEYICIAFDWSEKEKNYDHYYNLLYTYIKANNIKTDGIVYEISLPTSYSSLKLSTFLTELRVRKLS